MPPETRPSDCGWKQILMPKAPPGASFDGNFFTEVSTEKSILSLKKNPVSEKAAVVRERAVPLFGAVFFRTNVVQIWSPIFFTGKTILSALTEIVGRVESFMVGAERSRSRMLALPRLSIMAIGADAAASGLV